MVNVVSKRTVEQIQVNLRRSLDGLARVLVKTGENVGPVTTLAFIEQTAGEKLINLASLLEVAPEEVGRYLLVQPGAKILKGELIAKKEKSLTTKEKFFLSPMDGEFVNTNEKGEFSLRFSPRSYKLTSQVEGKVSLISDEFLEIVTNADLITGEFTFGVSSQGYLQRLAHPNESLKPDLLDTSVSGKIIFGGCGLDISFIEKARILEVKGIIVGGVDFSIIGEVKKMSLPFSLLITEGFGNHPIGADIFELLIRREKRLAFIDATKKQLITPQQGLSRLVESNIPTVKEVKIQDKVYVLDFQKGRLVGHLIGIRKIAPKDTDIKSDIALVRLENGSEIETFASNLEIIL